MNRTVIRRARCLCIAGLAACIVAETHSDDGHRRQHRRGSIGLDATAATELDCNGNGIPDGTDINDGTSEDCNRDGIPDECPVCPPVDVVFVMDTSGSMDDEAVALCSGILGVQDALAAAGIEITPSFLGITEAPGGDFDCLTNSVAGLLGGDVPGTADELDDTEDWGPATAVVAQRFPWSPDALRLIVPISDEDPQDGDGCNAADDAAVANAIAVANANDVIVSPVVAFLEPGNCDSDDCTCIDLLAAELAGATGGVVFESMNPDRDLPEGILGIILDACESLGDCNDNDVPDECDIEDGTSNDANGNGVPDECEAGDCNANGVPDDVETAPEHDPQSATASDDCIDADLVCTDVVYAGSTAEATPAADIFCGLAYGGLYDVFFRYRPATSGPAIAKVCNFGFVDAVEAEHVAVSVHSGCPATQDNMIVCNFASNVLQNCGAIWDAVGGETYWIRIAGEGDSRGWFDLEVKGPRCLLNPNDLNENGVPDECDCLGDVDGDGLVTGVDVLQVQLALGTTCPPSCDADVNSDGLVDEQDLAIVIASLGPCPF